MDENRLPELPQEAFRPMIAQSVQLEQFLGEELIFCFRDLDGVHTFTTCYGDIYKTVNALRDYVRLLESVCDQWELTGFHRATYEYHAEKLRKIALVMKCKEAGVPIICSMGAGNKMDPTRFEVTDIYKTSVCPLAKVMRTECRKRRIKHLKVVYSREPVMTPIEDDSISCKHHCICPPGTQRKCTIRRSVPGSNAFVPSVVGLIIGGEVVKDLVGFVPMKG